MSTKTKTAFEATLAELAEAFIEDTRADGSKFVRLRDGRPDWMLDAVREAHGGSAPHDWLYAACAEMAARLVEYGCATADDARDVCAEMASEACDTYNSDLLTWLATCPGAVDDTDEAVAQGYGGDVSGNVIELIRCGQFYRYDTIGHTFINVAEHMASDECEAAAEVSK